MKSTTEPLGDSDWNKQLLTAVDRTVEAWQKAAKEQEFEVAADCQALAVHAIKKLAIGIPFIKSSIKSLIAEDEAPKIALKKREIFIEEGPKSYLKIVDRCGGKRNDGLICLLGHGHIWLKKIGASPHYLIREIAAAGGVFDDNEKGYVVAPNGVPNCGVGGENYQGGRKFGSVERAILYLNRYFIVRGCRNNKKWTDVNIDTAPPGRPPTRPDVRPGPTPEKPFFRPDRINPLTPERPNIHPRPKVTLLLLPKSP